jgi:predicted transcriptional regulator
MTRSLLLSLRPRFAQAILAGTKTAEVRRRFPLVPVGTAIVIYSSSPQRSALGTARVRRQTSSTPEHVWRDFADEIALDRAELNAYLDGSSDCSVLEIEEARTWDIPVPLGELRTLLKLEPAQSFRYLTPAQHSRLVAAGAGA